jgi:hypothetical protein
MHFRALDSHFNALAIVDGYDSMIWTDHYNGVGDFELHGGNTDAMRQIANEAKYIFNSITKGLVEIEKPEAVYTEEDGSTLTISGQSASSFLDRRVIKTSKTLSFQTDTGDRRISKIICDLVDEAFEVSSVVKTGRYWDMLRIDNRTASTSVKLSFGTNPIQSLQFTMGDSLLTTVQDLCTAAGLGFRFEFSQTDMAVTFIVYEGANRAAAGQSRVMLSDLYDNLLTGRDMQDVSQIKTALLVVGNAVDPETQIPKHPQWVAHPEFTGINRREAYFQSGQDDVVFYTDGTQTAKPSVDYIADLMFAGTNELRSSAYQTYFEYEGAIIEVPGYEYGINFALGDVLGFLLPHHGRASLVRIEGITFSDDAVLGKTLSPIFSPGAIADIGTIKLGAFLNSPHTIPGLTAFEGVIGDHLDYFVMFSELDDILPNSSLMAALMARGTVPILTLQTTGYSLDDIISGSLDKKIKAFAATMPRGGILRPLHEMNGNWYDWGVPHGGKSATNTPAKYVTAFRRIVDLARSARPGIQINWCVNRQTAGAWDATIAPYWVGDAYCDTLGFDAYNLDDATGVEFSGNDNGVNLVEYWTDYAHAYTGQTSVIANCPGVASREGVVLLPTSTEGVVSNGTITGSAWVYGSSGTVQAVIKERNADDSLRGESVGPPVTLDGALFKEVTVSRTFNGGVGARIGVVTSSPQAITFWSDAFSLVCNDVELLTPEQQNVTRSGNSWQDYGDTWHGGLADDIHASLLELSAKPIIIVETSTHAVSRDGSEFVDTLFDWVINTPQVIGFCWFNDYNQDYQIDYTPTELQAFKDGVSRLLNNNL